MTRFSRHQRRSLAVSAALLTAALLAGLLAPLAHAATPVVHPFVGTIGGFTHPESVATDDSGDVYVLDGQTISKFDSAGNPVDFSALGTNSLTVPGSLAYGSQIAVDSSGGVNDGDIYVTTTTPSYEQAVDIYGPDGTLIGALTHANGEPFDSGLCAVAVDAAGNVYVGDASNSDGIYRYVPAGNPATDFDYDANVTTSVCDLAADSTGAVYGLDSNGDAAVTKFTADLFRSPGDGDAEEPGNPFTSDALAVAVDPVSDDVYVARASDITVFDQDGNSLGSFGTGDVNGPTGIAVSSAGDVFVANQGSGTVSIFGPPLVFPDVTTGSADQIASQSATLHGTVNPSGVAVTDCHFDYGTTIAYGQSAQCASAPGSGSSPVDVAADVSGLAPGTTYHFRLVASDANGSSDGSDETFDTVGAPGISNTNVGVQGTTNAIVTANINPRSTSTTYHVDYGPTTAYGSSTPESAPVGTDDTAHAVAATLTGLAPGTTYHFRFVATNASGIATGPDDVFTSCTVERSGPSAALPDCRAYEQVSPVDKGHADVHTDAGFAISPSSDAVSFGSYTPFPLSGPGSGPLSVAYAATRDSSSWNTFSISPAISSDQEGSGLAQTYEYGASSDFTKLMVDTPAALTPGAVDGNTNLYLYDAPTDSYTLMATTGDPQAYADVSFAGAAADGSSFAFSMPEALDSTPSPAAGASDNLYQWSSAGLALVGILPDGSIDPNGAAPAGAAGAAVVNHAVSSDGSKIYWTEANSSPAPIYLRTGGQTVIVSHDQSGAAQPATFWYATPDGAYAFFTSSTPLTADASPSGSDLYRYDAASDQVTDLTPDSADPGGAGVIGVFGASDDGTYVYYLATGALGSGATAGDPNIFVSHTGSPTRFIGALASDASEFTGGNFSSDIGSDWRVSPDGLGLGLLFSGAISGPNPQPAQPTDEAYYYSYDDDSLACASCSRTGLPNGPAVFLTTNTSNPDLGALTPTPLTVTDGGRMFFTSPDALLPADTNGRDDVYEYEQGELHLISTGQSDDNSILEGATPSGDDVFFDTYQPLVGQDDDNSNDLYDARVNGGLASQNPAPAAPACDADACQGQPTGAPPMPIAATVTFVGAGNQRNRSQPAKPRVLTRTARGAQFVVKVRVPGAGRITIEAPGITTVHRSTPRAGSYSLRVSLTTKVRKLLARKHEVRLRLRVTYAAIAGGTRAATVSIAVRLARVPNHSQRRVRTAQSNRRAATTTRRSAT